LGGQEREAFAGEISSSIPALRIQGKKKKHNTFKMALFCVFFNLCEHYMKWRPFAQNTLLHLKGNGAKNISNSK